MSEGSKIHFCNTCKTNTSHQETTLSVDRGYRKCVTCGEISELKDGQISVIKYGSAGKMMSV